MPPSFSLSGVRFDVRHRISPQLRTLAAFDAIVVSATHRPAGLVDYFENAVAPFLPLSYYHPLVQE
jgi:hypothetical protein